jgi:hypothetical protein
MRSARRRSNCGDGRLTDRYAADRRDMPVHGHNHHVFISLSVDPVWRIRTL